MLTPVCASLLSTLGLLATDADQWRFVEVSNAAGIDASHGHLAIDPQDELFFSGGAAVGDFDNDGWLDLYLVTGDREPDLLLRNVNGQFVDVSASSGINFQGANTGTAFADIDGDGLLDLFVGTARPGMPRMFRNLGNGRFQEQSKSTNFPQFYTTTSASFADYDKDSDLDLFLGQWNSTTSSLLWRNEGNFNYQSVSAEAFGAAHPQLRFTFTPNFSDTDGDGWLDLLVASDFGNSQTLANQADGSFALTSNSQIITDEHGMGAAVGDYDNDGDFDWFVTSIHYDGPANPGSGITGNRLYNNRGDGQFDDVTDAAGVRAGHWGWGACFSDFNNDGHLDLFHVNGWRRAGEVDFSGTPARLFMNNGDSSFSEQAAMRTIDSREQGRGVVCFDYDRDGDIDVLVTNNSGPFQLYRNDSESGNYLTVRLQGKVGNPFGVGAKVTAIAGHRSIRELRNGSNFLSANPLEAHFGLGSHDRVDLLKVDWPGGKTSAIGGVNTNQQLDISINIVLSSGFE